MKNAAIETEGDPKELRVSVAGDIWYQGKAGMDAGPRRVVARLARKSVQSFHKRLGLELAGIISVGDAPRWATGPDHKEFYKEWRDAALGAGYGMS